MIGCVALLLLKWTLLTNIPGDIRIGLLIVFPCLSRFGMLSTMATFSYVRKQGLGTAFKDGAKRWHVVFGLATAAVAGGALLGIGGLVLLSAAIVVSLGLGRWITGMLGGMTGDTYGAVNELAEVTVLLLGISLFSLLPSLYRIHLL